MSPLAVQSIHLLLLFSLPCFLSTTTNAHPKKQNRNNNNNTLHANMDPFEQDTLFKIMESMSSDRDWRVSNPNPCKQGSSWPGLECKTNNKDTHFHVIRLDFGSPPNPTCKQTATFPCQIFNLPYLESAFFFHCFDLTKTTLKIVSTISSSSTLQQLSLRSNQALVGPIPPQISSLKSLEILTLSQNKLHGKIPVEIFSLPSLIHLDLSYNSLVGTIPNQMGNLKNLVGLDLSYNSLSCSVPRTIGDLGLLQKLDLSSNSLTGIVPETIENLKLLAFLALSNNRFRGKFPKGITKLESLQYLLMDGNPMFMSLPNDLGNLVKLQELRLGNSGYSGEIPRSFSRLMNLSTLSLENNRLTGEIPVGLSNLSHIYHLNLSRNMLSGVVPFNNGFLKRLGRNLDLSGNSKLCLNGSQILDDGVKIGTVNICGSSNKNGYLIQQPFKKSDAASPCGFFSFSSLSSVITVSGIYQALF